MASTAWPEPELYLGKFHWRPSDPTESCVKIIGPEAGFMGEGLPYEEFLCLYPWLKPFYTNFELTWKPYWLGYVLLEQWWIPFVAVALYYAMIHYGTLYMKDREPWGLKRSLMLWNLGLSIFSVIGFFRILPVVVHILTTYTWYENLCFDPWSQLGPNPSIIWTLFFSLSKIAELLDTFFIIVNKKQLIFLHWYHHLTVLLYCWFYLLYTVPAGILFCLVNYGVHSIMYFYYFLMAAKMKPKWMNPKLITGIQIAQMVIGITVTSAGIYLNFTGYPHCFTRPFNVIPSMLIFATYFFLFVRFFVDRYYGKKEKKTLKIF